LKTGVKGMRYASSKINKTIAFIGTRYHSLKAHT